MQIIDRIAEKLSKDNMSVLKLSNETGISAYKIYKWLGKKGNPKHDDSIKLEQWLSGNVDKVQREPDIIATDGQQVFVAETKAVPAGFDKNQFIELLKRQIEVMQKNNEVLLRILDEKITAQETNLKECLSNQVVIMRQVSVAMHLAAARYAGEDKKKLNEELGKIDKLISSVHE